MRFDSHYKMTVDDIIDFVFEHTEFFESNENLVCKEIGDGNINYVYRVYDTKTDKSLILKQADVRTRVRPDGYLNPLRNMHEAEVLNLQFKLTEGLVPQVFFADKETACFIMEDIGGYSNLRFELMKMHTFPEIGKKLAEFTVKTTLPFTDIVFCGQQKPCTASASADLQKITENLVFTYPYKNVNGRNILLEENKEWLEEKFYKNEELAAAAAELKEKFKTYPQSLIHGDLHSGSVFVKEQKDGLPVKIKVIDPEFAFYAPIGFDLGNAAAHFIFACVHAKHKASKTEDAGKFCTYCAAAIKEMFEEFTRAGTEYLILNVKDPIFKNEKFLTRYIEKIKEDASLFAGAELNRRVIGSAKVPEITEVKDLETRIKIERELTDLGIALMTKQKLLSFMF